MIFTTKREVTMISKNNFKYLLTHLDFDSDGDCWRKSIKQNQVSVELTVDFANQQIFYPEKIKIYRTGVLNFNSDENFVVFECVHALLTKGYKANHIELEPTWKVGHGSSGGRADILINNHQKKPLLLIECKTYGGEFEKEWKDMLKDGGQLFSYAQQTLEVEFLCLYATDFVDGKVVRDHRIISHKDNPEILKQNKQNNKLRSFFDAKDAEGRFRVWRDTYKLEYTESGIFEDSIRSYEIGKSKYALSEDTKPVTIQDNQGTYDKFRTILRTHNIARRENAFEVLVNLFLCKIVDEEYNPEDLKFYWKGIAYDNYFDFVDRLQNLYRIGMDKFLNEKISYISNEQINSAFWAVKNNDNATKQQIQDYFRELKFFTNSAFSFIDTHNEELFNKNSEVLVKVVRMWQGLRLKSDGQNQFLGDMFEYFLDSSIKQSNGQFFTPLPICKFIVSSLPLDKMIRDNEEPLRTIDYACGAGHFLTEYAYQITSLINDDSKLKASYQSIVGVEKEYRLAKVAKVASHMHGYENINILDADALAAHPDLPINSFNILIANPPFSVKGFLQTLEDEDKDNYALVKSCGKISENNNIQCFFLERIHHLMAPGGVVGVIVPVSIFSNADALSIQTREIILQFFEVVSIVELGDKTFGKTGTNTIILFLRRRANKPQESDHYANRVTNFFAGDDVENKKNYQDEHLLEAYCKHIKIPLAKYKKFMRAKTISKIESLFEYDVFQTYKSAHNKTGKSQNEIIAGNELLAHMQNTEKDKLLYFILAAQQSNKVLIVNAPTGSSKQKKFLGYEWGARRGNEGIKYNGGESVNDIITPMFNPENLSDAQKINTAIRNNFLGNPTTPLPEYCRLARLVDMLDFDRDYFDKRINLNPQGLATIDSKWELVKLGEFCELEPGVPAKVGERNYLEIGDIDVATKKYDVSGKEKMTVKGAIKVPANTLLISTVRPTRGAIAITVAEVNVSSAFCRIKLQNSYIYHILNQSIFFEYLGSCTTGVQYPVCKSDDILNFKIPNPPVGVQNKIVAKCKTADSSVEKSHQRIATARQQIKDKVKIVNRNGYEEVSLDRVCETIFAGGDIPKNNFSKTKQDNLNIPVFSNGSKNKGLHGYTNKARVTQPSITISARGTIGHVELRDSPFYPVIRLIVAIPKREVVLLRYLYLSIKNTDIAQSGGVIPQLTTPMVNRLKIPLPPLDTQQQLVSEVAKLEAKIKSAYAVIRELAETKNKILADHL